MVVFIKEYLWTVGLLVGFALAGGFVIIPFRKDIKFSFFAAPLAGILMVILGTSAIYNLVHLHLFVSAFISVTLCIMTTISCIIFSSSSILIRPDFRLLVFSGLAIGFITYLSNYSTIFLGHPGFLFMDGTDHLGYAQLADWLNQHLASERPVESYHLPYQMWPSAVFSIDPRFGSYFLLGFISDLRNQTGMFSYDFTCGVMLSAGILAISALFSKSPLTFVLLFLALLTTHWFEYGRAGYFGKMSSYTSSLFTIGLFLVTSRPFSISIITVLAALTCASAIMHSYLSTILILGTIGATFIIAQVLIMKNTDKKYSDFRDNCFVLILLIGISIASCGTLSRPMLSADFPKHPELSWAWLLPRLFDLEHHGSNVTAFTSAQLLIGFILLLATMILFLVVGIRKKKSIAISLIAGPLVVLCVLISLNKKSELYQLVGTFYPWFLCAGVTLLNDINFKAELNKLFSYGFLALFISTILLHVPLLVGSTKRYAGKNINKTLQFSKLELDNLFDVMEGKSPEVDVKGSSYYSFPLIVELDRHKNAALQWTPESWKSIPAMRPEWPSPKVDTKNHFRLVLNSEPVKKHCKIKFSTAQYYLLEC